MTALARPASDEYAAYYGTYIGKVPDTDVLTLMQAQGEKTLTLLAPLSESRAAYRYAPGKRSVKQVLGHVIDGERLFAHRALAIARCDPADQPSMDQEIWMAGADFDARSMGSLCDEYRAVRTATLALFRSFDAKVALRRGKASGNPFSVRALVWTVAGHELHHLGILRERYHLG